MNDGTFRSGPNGDGRQATEPPSLWSATAPPGPQLERLRERRTTDVAVIGAGYTGLSAALHLAAAGVETVVIDTHAPGWGASGRNGGQVLPGFRVSRQALERQFGAAGACIHEIAEGSAHFLFDLVDRHGIECDLARSGSLRVAHNERALEELRENHAALVADGVAARLLSADEVGSVLGTSAYLGGRFDPRSGTIHPLKYARGLAAAALRAGATLYRESPATALTREGGLWRVASSAGELIARNVVIATNGYTDGLWAGLAATLLPVHSFQIATAPLDAARRAEILPNRVCFSDSRRLILYGQRTADHRLVLGGRASFTLIDRDIDYQVLRRVLIGLFPQLAETPIEYRWVGRVALTRDFIPHLHAPAPGLLIAVGFNGKGVALTTLMGKLIADHIRAPEVPLQFPVTNIRPIPLHRFRRPALHMAMHYHTLMDRLGR